MAPAWAQFESTYKDRMRIVYVNVDQRDKPEFKENSQYMERAIPHTVWLSSKGQVLEKQTGSLTLEQLSQASDKALKL
jgi:hypothetical protein